MRAKYINPYTDFGFKKLFGEEANKDLLADFLNQMLPEKHKIVELTFKNSEQLAPRIIERKAIFDIHCKNEKGDLFIVEMQKSRHQFIKDRAVYYMTFPIKEQAEKGEWNFKLTPVYCVAILDFVFEDDREKKGYLSDVKLKDQYCRTFYDKLNFIFLEMPLFTKKENELENHFEKWLYFLKHLETFDTIPDILKEEVFLKGFKIAELANYTKDEMVEYEESLKVYRDLKGVIETSFDDGKKEGAEEEKIRMAEKMKQKGTDIEFISEITGLSIADIQKL